ncbi:MAG: hypothetical protein CMI26_07415 [Opitutae bacterium]|nr:hypothetical protein [Opitutae bacterium]
MILIVFLGVLFGISCRDCNQAIRDFRHECKKNVLEHPLGQQESCSNAIVKIYDDCGGSNSHCGGNDNRNDGNSAAAWLIGAVVFSFLLAIIVFVVVSTTTCCVRDESLRTPESSTEGVQKGDKTGMNDSRAWRAATAFNL